MYVINLDVKNSKGTHWIALFSDRNTAISFDSFRSKTKSKIKQLLTIYLECKIMNILCVDFIASLS